MNVFIVIPCYNEEDRILNVLKEIDNLKLQKKIIVVDDGSIDNSCEIIRRSFGEVILLEHKINLGKGAALKTGCEGAIKLGADVIVLIDGDGQHSPSVIPDLVEKIEKEDLDIVFASRVMDTKKMPMVLYFGNKFLTGITNLLSGTNIYDSQSGFKAFKSSAYNKLVWNYADYSVETEIILNVGKNKLRYGEIFIDTIYNDRYKGTTPFDGVKVLINLIKARFL